MEKTSRSQEPIFPENKKLKVFAIVWCWLVALAAVGLNIWAAQPRDITETKQCSVYGYQANYGKNGYRPVFSTLECGDLYFPHASSDDEATLYESLVGQLIQADVLIYQTGFTPDGVITGTPMVGGSLKVIDQ